MSPSLVAAVETKAKTEVPAALPMSPAEEITLLEKSALEKGMSPERLGQIQQIGNCPAQVELRIEHLHEWHASH